MLHSETVKLTFAGLNTSVSFFELITLGASWISNSPFGLAKSNRANAQRQLIVKVSICERGNVLAAGRDTVLIGTIVERNLFVGAGDFLERIAHTIAARKR